MSQPRLPAIPPTTDPYPELSDVQLKAEAAALGADVANLVLRGELLEALALQRKIIASLEEREILEVLTWAGLSVPSEVSGEGLTARKERLARFVSTIRTMRFAGLSPAGLKVLALLRGIPVRGDEPVPVLVEYLKAREGLLDRLHRKKRSLLGSLAQGLLGSSMPGPKGERQVGEGPKSLKHEIEEQGLLGGISSRLRKSADTYVQEKLDEIESRIDRKLDEIDQRLSDWRDKEIANRIRIIKITLWASVVISALSLVYLYVKGHLQL